MQRQQQTPSRSRVRRRSTQRSNAPIGILTTALAIGAVLILLATTFVADWMHTPSLTLSTTTQILSPNGDRDHDTIAFSYNLSEEAAVTARVLSDGGGVVRLLLNDQTQTAGQHFIDWDGRNEIGGVVDDGHYRLEVIARGSVRGESQGITFQVDTKPPALQLVNLPNETRVGEETLTVQGITDPDAIVWASGEPQPLIVDNQGHFAFQRKLNEGSNLIEIRSVDPAGNTTRLHREVVLVTEPPDVVVTQPTEGEWTNQAIIDLHGQAPAGTTLTVNDQTVIVEQDGKFQHEILLEEGENQLRISATDDVGNVTTLERIVYLKTTLPEIGLNVADGATVSDSLLQVVGHTDPGTTVMVNGHVVPISALGDFQTTLFLNEGANALEVRAFDQAGNETTISRQIRFTTPQSTDGITRLMRNLEELPALLFPTLIVIGLFVGLFLLRQSQISLALSVDQGSFTPGLPGENKMLELSLDLNKPARVTLEVLDQSGYVLATLLNNRRRSARIHQFYWDGYDDYGKPANPGEYTIQATAGINPIKVTSAVQVNIQEDTFVHRQADQRPLYRRRTSLSGRDFR